MELALYCVPRALYSVYLKQSRAGRLPHIPSFDLFLFAVSAGVLMHFAENEPESVRRSIFAFVRWLFNLQSVRASDHPGSGGDKAGDAAPASSAASEKAPLPPSPSA